MAPRVRSPNLRGRSRAVAWRQAGASHAARSCTRAGSRACGALARQRLRLTRSIEAAGASRHLACRGAHGRSARPRSAAGW
eukprot:scaffold41534_cov70-Phaeocystis_antarctica.AAC.1